MIHASKRYSFIMIFGVLLLSKPVKAFDPSTIILTAALNAAVTGTIAGVLWLTSPSQDEKEYQERHRFFSMQSKSFFAQSIREARERGELEGLLTQHELYRYENFLSACQAECPQEFFAYLKSLEKDLDIDYKKREVRGFVVTRNGTVVVRNLRGSCSYDTFEFYELVKNLLADIDPQDPLADVKPLSCVDISTTKVQS